MNIKQKKARKEVFLDATTLYDKRTGVGQYFAALMREVLKKDSNNSYTFFRFLAPWKTKQSLEADLSTKSHMRYIRTFPGRVYSKLFKFGAKIPLDWLLNTTPDVFVFPAFIAYPSLGKSKVVIIVYDVSFLVYPQYTHDSILKYYNKYLPDSIRQADKIITISEHAKSEIMHYYKVPDEKLDIVYPAVDHKRFNDRQVDISHVKSKYALKEKYILFTGTIEPRKNILGLLEAYSLLPKKITNNYQLVLAGGKGWLDEDIHRRLQELEELDIVVTGYVEDDELPKLYKGAAVFVYPSFYEGFGMPPLEAMACGVPVITSNNSSLPEVIGQAGISVNATDSQELSRQIEKVLSNPALAKKMISAGYRQAKKFSWSDSAKNFQAVIDTLPDSDRK